MKNAMTLVCLWALAPVFGFASQQMIPAGALVQCTVSDPKISSKTTAIGDPVLCHLTHAERFGNAMLPYHSSLAGRFEDYSDPGRLIGKGWMELRFDRLVIEPNTVIPIDAKVVAVPGYNVDRDGRILGKGHAVRDAIKWAIPVLWPIDLLTLPRRGPRPTLKAETRLVLKVMDDLMVPVTEQPQPDPSGLMRRVPSAALEPLPAPGLAQDDSMQETAAAEDPSAVAGQPSGVVYVPVPVPSTAARMAYRSAAPVAMAPPVARRAYRPAQIVSAPPAGARMYYQPRRIAQPPRVYRYGSAPYGYSASRFAAAPRAYSPVLGQRGFTGSSAGGVRLGSVGRR